MPTYTVTVTQDKIVTCIRIFEVVADDDMEAEQKTLDQAFADASQFIQSKPDGVRWLADTAIQTEYRDEADVSSCAKLKE